MRISIFGLGYVEDRLCGDALPVRLRRPRRRCQRDQERPDQRPAQSDRRARPGGADPRGGRGRTARVDGLRHLEAAGRAGPGRTGGRDLHRNEPPLRDRLRHERPSAPRCRAQRFRGSGDCLRDDHHPQRRHAVATLDPYCGHGPGDRLGNRPAIAGTAAPSSLSMPGRISGTTRSELADEVARAIPGVNVSLAGTGEPDRRSYRVSFERYRELAPDHQPEVDIQRRSQG